MARARSYGPNLEDPLFEAHGIERNYHRIRYYRELWRTES